MYEIQARPEINGRRIVAHRPRRYSNSNFYFRAIDTVIAFLESSSPLASHTRLASLLLLSMCVAVITGCGVSYKTGTQGNGVALSAVSCGTQSLTGAQTKTCSLSLNSASLTSMTVKLSSSNSALKVPSQAKIAVGQNSVSFDAVTAGVSKSATVTITASYRGVSKSAVVTLYPAGTGSGSGSGSGSSPQSSTAHKVQLSWSAPGSSTIAVAGYNVYRATVGVSTYALLNPTLDAATSYVDTGVQSGLTYNYVVKSVDITGAESSPSNATSVTIP